MVRTFTRHLRGNAVAYVALFFALEGTAYAAATVGSAQVLDNSLLSRELRDNGASSVEWW